MRSLCGLLLWLASAAMVLATEPPPQKVSLQLQWKHQFEFAGFYAAKQQGYYRDVGLEVEFVEYSPDIDTLEEVLSGRKEFGIWGAQLIRERLQGVPVVLVGNYFKRSPLVILAQPDISSPGDLRGRRLMAPEGDIGTVSYQIMFRQFGLRTEDIVLVPHSFRVDEFLRGEVDAMSAFVTDQPFYLRQAGKPFNVLDPNNYGAELYDVNLFTSEAYARKFPAQVRAFRDASNRGWDYALAHPEELIALILRDYNTQGRSAEGLRFEARETNKVMLPRVYPVGDIDSGKLRRMAELYVQLGEADSLDGLQGFVLDGDSAVGQATETLQLSAEERAFVAEHPVIRVSNEIDWPPFDFFENGAAQGYSVDLLRLVARKIGVQIEFVQHDTWPALVQAFCDKEIDILHPTDRSTEATRCGLFTEPVIRETSQFLTRRDFKPVHEIQDLFGSVVATPAGWEQTEVLRRLYPDRLRFIETKGIEDAIDAVRDGRADATTDFGSSLHYHINRSGYTNLIVQGMWTRADKGGEFEALYLAARNDWPILQRLLQRGLAAVSVAERRELQMRWLDARGQIAALDLSAEERAFLRAHPVIRASSEVNYPPFDFLQGGEPSGYSIELLNLLAERVGFRVEYVTHESWSELIEMHRRGEIDLLHSLFRSADREVWGEFSQPYMRVRQVFVNRKGGPRLSEFAELEGKVVAVGKGWAHDDYLARNYPAIRRLPVENVEQMLDAVSTGRADATLESEAVLRYWMDKKALTDLQVAGWVRELAQNETGSHYFMGQKSAPELVGILDKAMASLTPADLRPLQSKWLSSLQQETASLVELSVEESSYLRQKGRLRLCVDPESPPYERINEKGNYEGVGADLAQLISDRINLPLETHVTPHWDASLAALRARDCDLMLLVTDLPSRRDRMDFTRTYVEEPLVVATRASEVFVRDIQAIGDRPVAIVKGYSYSDILRQRHPDIHIVDVESAEHGLADVRDGRVWGYIGSIPAVAYSLAKHRMFDLKIAGKLEVSDELSVATRNDEPLLVGIMQKAIDSISDAERREIINRWISVRYEQAFDYALFWKIGAAALLVLFAIGIWNRKLARFNTALGRAKEQAQSALSQVAMLLDNSGQGFLSFGPDLVVEPGCSRECERIFGGEADGRKLPDLLAPANPTLRGLVGKTLPRVMASADALQRDAYLSLLPREIVLGQQVLHADYRLIGTDRMMLVLTDISAEKALAERLAQERLRLEFVVQSLENREDLLSTLREFEDFRSRALPDLLSFQRDPMSVLDELYRRIHTFKGLFAQAGLPLMPEQLHDLESKLANLRQSQGGFDLSEVKRVLGSVDLGAVLEQDLEVLREKLGSQYFSGETEIHLAASLIDQLQNEAEALYGADSRMLDLIRQLRFEPLTTLLAPYGRAMERLAKRQGKLLAPIRFEGLDMRVDPAVLGPFCRSLSHVLRNAVDHGIEDPDTRLLADKPELGSIVCRGRVDAGRLILSIEDDGCGLDLAAIAAKAADLGLIDAGETESFDLADAGRMLFADGFSTRASADVVSGRGVGLAAVRVELERIDGDYRVESVSGKGTRFVFSLPYVTPRAVSEQDSPLQRANLLLQPLPKVMRAFCLQHLDLAIEFESESREISANDLGEFTAVIGLGSGLDAEIGLSMNRPLLMEMTRRFGPEFAEHELTGMAVSVGAEILNTLVGNATVYFTHLAHHVDMGTPQVVDSDDYPIRFGERVFRAVVGRAEAGEISLFCILREELMA
ncbi:transporter substrate-binding domain-containing protein [Pseudomarimonas arenosa]|uniref:histidine kinase n=1 Tax=Pseudomarimonas arenosa TaxID=2774145 RepID=A0AAW3ZMM5_9GAMM|nr:transporter substrate-binding domain-containing protein [Pseudomarimonas arenosa]MBD8527218.1 transporter substrate-binding domain-containing protein [Pseudomarimonas arenosa]